MCKNAREKFFHLFYIPDDLTLEKIDARAENFRETKEGKIEFDIMRHPTLFGEYTSPGSPSPARWHIEITYTYDPENRSWEVREGEPELQYDADMFAEREMNVIREGGTISDLLKEGYSKKEVVEKILQNLIRYFKETPTSYPLADKERNKLIKDLIEELEPLVKKDVAS